MRNLGARIHGYGQRKAADLFHRRPLTIAPERPVISFTFDDFPRSALLTGGRILQQAGLRATYYASFGLMGSASPTGEMFTIGDVHALVEQGHELGCHTYHHCDSWRTPPDAFARSIAENRRAFGAAAPDRQLSTFSYPICPPRPSNKRVAGEAFECCRGSGQTFNAGEADLNNLRACFLEQTGEDPELVQKLIDGNTAAHGWLIFATHDVDNGHTPYGCTPRFFDQVVQRALLSGAAILPVAGALESLQRSDHKVIWAKPFFPSQNRGRAAPRDGYFPFRSSGLR